MARKVKRDWHWHRADDQSKEAYIQRLENLVNSLSSKVERLEAIQKEHDETFEFIGGAIEALIMASGISSREISELYDDVAMRTQNSRKDED